MIAIYCCSCIFLVVHNINSINDHGVIAIFSKFLIACFLFLAKNNLLQKYIIYDFSLCVKDLGQIFITLVDRKFSIRKKAGHCRANLSQIKIIHFPSDYFILSEQYPIISRQ